MKNLKSVLAAVLTIALLLSCCPMTLLQSSAATTTKSEDAASTAFSSTVTYTFANYPAGTQYAAGEVHKLDDNVTVTTNGCYFTHQLRIYQDASYNGNAVFACTKAIKNVTINAGYKISALEVYGSEDGVSWNLITTVNMGSVDYGDYTVEMPAGTSYKYLKLDSVNAQIRIPYITFEFAEEVPEATEPAVTVPDPTEPPATESPITEPAATEPPATEPPTTEPPTTEPTATEPTATETPAEAVPEGLEYVITDGEVSITGYNGSANELVIPHTIDGYPVTTIGDYAFYDCDWLTSITIPDSVTVIGYGAFEVCASLISITIPDGVTTIDDWAFCDCDSLTSITIPDSVTSIGDYAFSWCDSLTSVTIPNSVTSIGRAAFQNCSSLTGIWVDADNPNYSSDQSGVFFNKDKTELISAPGGIADSYVIPDSVTSIRDSAFRDCTSLNNVTIPDSVTSIGTGAFQNCTGLTSVTIGNSVTSIDLNAFSNCSSLTNVTIGDSVTNIEDYAFSNCSSLTSITIPDSVTTIGADAFEGCTSLTEIWVNADNPNYSSDGQGVLFNKAKTTLIQAPNGLAGSYAIPDSVTSIGDYAFEFCTSLTSVTIGNGVTGIGNNAFGACTSLTSVTIGNGVTVIGDGAFGGCTSLAMIAIPNSVTSIGDYAFSQCENLTDVCYGGDAAQWETIAIGEGNEPLTSASIHIGEVTGIAIKTQPTKTEYWLWEDLDITGLTLIATYEDGSFAEITEGFTISGFDSSTVGFKKVTVTYQDKTAIFYVNVTLGTCGDNLTWILDDTGTLTISGTGAMGDYYVGSAPWNSYCTNIKTVVIESGVTTIGNGAFVGCTSLTSVSIPDSMTQIGEYAFAMCTSLTEIRLPDGLTRLHGTFYRCSSLKSVTIPETVTAIDIWTFRECSSLTEIVIPDSVTYLCGNAINTCTNLTSITIGKGLAKLDEFGFLTNCPSLTGIWVDAENTAYCSDEYGVLFNKDKTFLIKAPGGMQGGYEIPDGVIRLEDSAFLDCESLTAIALPVSTTDLSGIVPFNNNLKVIFYEGTEEQKNALTLSGEGLGQTTPDIALPNVTWHYEVTKLAHEDGVIYRCGKCGQKFYPDGTPVPSAAEVAYWNVSLQDDLQVNFYLQVDQALTDSAQVKLTVDGTVQTYQVSQLPQNDEGYYVVSVKMAAAQMTENISVFITYDGRIGFASTYCVRDYADTILADESFAAYHTIVRQMLHYGAAAQLHFGFNVGSLANEGLADLAAQDVPLIAPAEPIIDNRDSTARSYGVSLVCRDKIAVRFYFELEGDWTAYRFACEGKTYSLNMKDGMIYMEIADILPQDLDQSITVSVTDADGNVLTVTYSPMNYIVRMHQKGSDSLKAMLKALYNYHLAAKALRTAA